MADQNSAQRRSRPRVGLTLQIVIGLVLGLIWGLFLGEHGSWVKWAGDVYIGLLQMTVLPYVAVSLIANIGRLSAAQSGRLAFVALRVLLLLWLIGLSTLCAMKFSYPTWYGGSFFSTSLVEEAAAPNWLELFVPANLFHSLTNEFVPAVVLFAIGFGAALIPIVDKEVLLKNLDIIVDGLSRLNRTIVRLSPIGVFAIVGHASGTISLEQFELLQGYVLVYGAAAALLVFWILPSLIANLTPISHRAVLRASRDLLITAFIIGNTFVVLPMIVDAVERLIGSQRDMDRAAVPSAGYTVQLAYPFPDVGRIVGLVFIPFAAWFYGTQIDVAEFGRLVGTGFVGTFAKPVITIPLLLDLAQIPMDIFNLFLAVGIVAGRFGDLMKAMHLLAFSVITASVLAGTSRRNYAGYLRVVVTSAGLCLVTVLLIRAYLGHSFQDRFSKERRVVSRTLLGEPVESTILQGSAARSTAQSANEDPMDRILDRGVIRIGFSADVMPFCYYNSDRQLVGFDIDMAHQLARDLGVRIEFVPLSDEIITPLVERQVDIAMSGLEGTVKRATSLPQTEPYMEVTRAFVVPDHRRKQFQSLSRLARELPKEGKIRAAYVAGSIQAEGIGKQHFLDTAGGALEASGIMRYVQPIEVRSEREFFESDPPIADVLATSAEEGSAWTLKYPHFAVVKPRGWNAQTPLYYFVAEESRFEEFMNGWLKLKRLDGTVDRLYDYWILGKNSDPGQPRWCVLRDVLHWLP